MLRKAREIIRATLGEGQRVLVGLSGGADSVALAHLLYTMGYPLLLVHINFRLRGEESDSDEQHVAHFAKHHLPSAECHFAHVDTIGTAKEEGISIEMAARKLRYKLFRQLAESHHCDWIAVAHHANDQIETALLNLLRGTGGKGMGGMQVTSGTIFRPLLTTWREEIIEYLRLNGLEYVNDSTNLDTTIKRNYVRHELLSACQRLNPSFANTLLEDMAHFREEQQVLEEGLTRFVADHLDAREMSMSMAEVSTSVTNRYYFKRWLTRYHFSPSQAEDILRDWDNPKTITFVSDEGIAQVYRGRLYLIAPILQPYRPSQLGERVPLPDVGEVYFGTDGDKVIRLHERYRERPLAIRMGRADDRFTPLGMKGGSKPLFRYLGEKSLPEYYRSFCPVVVCGEEIVAVLPFEVSNGARYAAIERSLPISWHASATPLGRLLKRMAADVDRNS